MHVEGVHEGVKYKCQQCDKGFSHPRNLKRHIETIHDGVKKYKCDFCGKDFNQSAHLKGHIINAHIKEPVRNNRWVHKHKARTA